MLSKIKPFQEKKMYIFFQGENAHIYTYIHICADTRLHYHNSIIMSKLTQIDLVIFFYIHRTMQLPSQSILKYFYQTTEALSPSAVSLHFSTLSSVRKQSLICFLSL